MAELEAEIAVLKHQDEPLLNISFRLPAIFLVLAAGLAVRLVLAVQPGFGADIGLFEFWADQMAHRGPWHFYDSDFFIDYAPGYLYVLWIIGELNQLIHFNAAQYEYVIKLPPIIADLASAYLLYRVLDNQSLNARVGAAGLYLLLPATLLIGPIWGQVDSMLAFFLLLCVYYIGRGRPLAGALAFTVGFLVKPQAIAALPFLAVWIMRQTPVRTWAVIGAGAFALTLLLIVPFFTYKPWDFIVHLYNATNVENYRVDSFWAYNFWTTQGLFDGGLFSPDNQKFLGVTHRIWGFVMFGVALLAIIVATWRSKSTGILALGTSLSVLVFYMFLTRMHERYVFAFFLPYLAACALLQSRLLWGLFVALAAAHFLNLYHVYSYYRFAFPPNVEPFYKPMYEVLQDNSFLWTGLETVQALSALMLLAVPALIAYAAVHSRRSVPPEIA